MLVACRGISYLTFFFAGVLLLLFVFNLQSRIYYQGPYYNFLIWTFLYATGTAIGLLRCKRWGVLLFATPTFAAGTFLIYGTIEQSVPIPGSLINIGFALSFV